ncbi:MAG: ice-binding family protein, partial [Terriglobales bacterium]
QIGVQFSKDMNPATISTTTFAIAGIASTVSYDAINRIATCKPLVDLLPNTTYNATVTTGVQDLQGTPMAAPYNFSFATRSTRDTSASRIVAINLASGAICVPLNQVIRVTFEQPMDSLTINASTFFITGITGAVTYDPGTQTASLTPSNLQANSTYTINVTVGAKDMAGNPLLAPYQQTFTTGPCVGGGPTAVALCPFIGNFAVLAGTTVTNTGGTVISGDVGVSPGSAATGFPPGSATAIHTADTAAAQAQAALTAAYIDAAARPGGASVSGDLVGQTLVPGIYKSTSSLGLTGDLTLNANGNPDAVWIFQISSTLITGSGSRVIMINNGNPCNVFWQVGSSATLGTNSIFKGSIMALTSISLATGAQMEGRALARNGAVTLDTNTVTGCVCP